MSEKENRFKKARLNHNRNGKQSTQTVFKATGISKSLIEDLESNVLEPRDTGYLKVARLAQHYGVTVDYLAGLSDCPSTDTTVRAICDYTGLSENSVNLLHRMQESIIADKTEHNYAAKPNQAQIDVINLVLENADITETTENYVLEDAEISDADFPYVESLFTYMYQYIHAEDVTINLDPAFPDQDKKLTSEDCKTAAKAMGITEKELWVNFGNYFQQTSIIGFARAVMLDKITYGMKQFARRKNNG